MAEIKFKLENKLMTVLNQEILTSGGTNVDKCIFSFSEEWSGYVKTAVFYQNKDKVQYAVLNADDTCMIPAEAMSREGYLHIGVFGIDSAKVLSSTMIEMFISQGAVSGDTVSTEPADDVFLAIIAQYQRIAGLMNTYDELAKQCSTQMTELKAILTAINAYDVEEVTQRLNQIEDRMIDHVNLAKQIQNREIILRDVGIHFADKICRVENAAITENSLCDVYFDEYSYEIAAKALILPVAHDGYLDLTSSVDIREELTANILVRRA